MSMLPALCLLGVNLTLLVMKGTLFFVVLLLFFGVHIVEGKVCPQQLGQK